MRLESVESAVFHVDGDAADAGAVVVHHQIHRKVLDEELAVELKLQRGDRVITSKMIYNCYMH